MNLLSDHEDGAFGLQGIYCCNSGQEIEVDLIQKFLNIMMEIKMSLFNIQVDNNNRQSAEQIFRQQFDRKLRTDAQLSSKQALMNSLFEWFLRYEAIENGCDTMSEVSMASYTDWTDFCNGALLNFRYGYKTLLDWFCNRIPTDMIHLNKEVTNIQLNDGYHLNRTEFGCPLVIRYRDTRLAPEQNKAPIFTIECSHVIVTVSIGFLKRHLDTLFTPPLPMAKRKIIKQIGFGTVNKIFLQFDKPFRLDKNTHSPDSNGLKLIWLDDQQQTSKYPTWARDIISFEGVRRQPNVLVGWVGGHGARLMECETDATIGQTCMRILRQFLPPTDHERPAKLQSCFATRWHSNQFTCGSYSFRSMRSLDDRIEQLGEPICISNSGTIDCESSTDNTPVLMFAGEATAGKLYSTTHGAIITGWREADRLIPNL